ncbi:MAG: aminoglycoside phosphotransferase [Comamonadaceae bacterium]|nr:MAG: aminoglycoside phosphotransferase [Comamonadaceae bacterium]
MDPPGPADVAQTTPTGHAVAMAVAGHYAVGEVTECALLRRGFNHVYGLAFRDGTRAVARLSADRPRGAPNTDYEAALLAHLKGAGVSVAASLPTRDGAAASTMHLPEGARTLMLFEHLGGDTPGESLPDVEATGRALASLHEAGTSYRGPASRYTLELPHLLWSSLRHLCAAPSMDAALCEAFTGIAGRLEERIMESPALSRVACHGDCHGSNNFMSDGPDGARIASFFDFDDAGPGYLAYELCVYLWAMLPRKVGGELDASQRERWRSYLSGYRSVRRIGTSDVEAIAAFVAVRQFWLMGEYAGRIAVWGTQTMPTSWLRKQVELLTAWQSLETPD